ncbi:MAG: exodeoxyribonuclease VII large subunit [Candidatus Marinimicrobia bacterium]|nr:exodeoxyribonuclease VII large subunit [Candidatus Neomarinimicrobiota bacterium]
MRAMDPPTIISKDKAVSVSELTKQIKSVFEGEFSQLWVSGELSNVVHHRSGHLYFTLKDESAEIRAVMFRGFRQYLPFTPEDGMSVLAFGSLSVYEPRGQYQLVVKQMEAAGIGSLFLALEALKRKLSNEGLFDKALKKLIPSYPKTVGVITSSTGAAVRDILNILERRAPHVSVCLRPALVQGNGAADDLISALKQMGNESDAEVIIIGRGGGSLEDLWAFNDEKLARAIAECDIPVISAVGHETDFTIADIVADLRAPTPSVAAELAAVPLTEIVGTLRNYRDKLTNQMGTVLNNAWQKLDHVIDRTGVQEPSQKISRYKDQLTGYAKKLKRDMDIKMTLNQTQATAMCETLVALSPRGVLERGYSLAYTYPDNFLIRRAKDVKTGDSFILETGDGQFEAEKTKDIPKE